MASSSLRSTGITRWTRPPQQLLSSRNSSFSVRHDLVSIAPRFFLGHYLDVVVEFPWVEAAAPCVLVAIGGLVYY